LVSSDIPEFGRMRRREFITCGLVVALSAYEAQRNALARGNYPEKTIRILVGFPSGGPPDVASRLLADKFSVAWGIPVIVENITGAGGNIAIDHAIKAAPDGYTLVMASSAITINPSLYKKTSYDPIRDLAPISMAVFTPSILVVNNEVPANNVQELIALARSLTGKLTYGHAGTGTPAHLSGELFKSLAGIDIAPVPYRGIPALLPDLLAGRVTMTLPNMSVVLPLVREGKLRALAAISPTRATAAPNLPTMVEQGLPGFDVPIWFGLMAPAGTSPSIIAKLHQETVRALTAKEALKRLGDAGMEVVANTPTEFAAVIRLELSRWAKLIKDAGITVSE
jgi:tripartite-type tricarboxylate transporter receptor subunit TctC